MRRQGLRLAYMTVLALTACGDGTSPSGPAGAPANLTVVSGDQQEGVVGTPVARPLVVQVTDARGRNVPGVVVGFRVVSGGGSLFVDATQTNAEGQAQDFFTLGESTTAEHRVEARVTDATDGGVQLAATFTAIPRPDSPARIGVGPPFGNVCVEAGTASPQPPSAQIFDRFENLVPDVTVTFAPGDNSGSVVEGTQTTGPDGTAAPQGWTVGTHAGQAYEFVQAALLVVTVPGAVTGGLGQFVVPNTPAALRLDAAPSTAPAGSQVILQVTVLDRFGNVVDQLWNTACIAYDRLALDWDVIEGGGCLIPTQPCLTTRETMAFPSHMMFWVLGATPGTNRLRVTVRGHPEIAPVSISVTGT